MNSHGKKPIIIDKQLFFMDQLTESIALNSFSCLVEECNEYLWNEAVKSQKDQMALTWLFRERSSGAIAAYMSLIADAIKLSVSEKELHNLDYPFKTVPAVKIAKLAVSLPYSLLNIFNFGTIFLLFIV